jgi:hypothetical protein
MNLLERSHLDSAASVRAPARRHWHSVCSLIDKFLSCLSEQRLKGEGDFMAAQVNLIKHTARVNGNAFHNAARSVAARIEREAT